MSVFTMIFKETEYWWNALSGEDKTIILRELNLSHLSTLIPFEDFPFKAAKKIIMYYEYQEEIQNSEL